MLPSWILAFVQGGVDVGFALDRPNSGRESCRATWRPFTWTDPATSAVSTVGMTMIGSMLPQVTKARARINAMKKIWHGRAILPPTSDT